MKEKKTCMPPDPNTKFSLFKAPPKTCDAHCHIFGPAHLFPYHESSSYFPPDAGKDRLKALHDTLGIERKAAPDRVLWGTDFPHPNIKKFMPNDGDLLDLVPLFTRDPVLQQKILVDNPARLYGY